MSTRKRILPPGLARGDVLGIVAPAGQVADRERFARGVAILSEMGFEPRFPRELWPGPGYLADSDHNRARELHEMFADTEVKAVMAARGGYGCLRLLEHVDHVVLEQHPKPLVGFSDITALLNHANRQASLLCFHGPVVTSLGDCTNEALERFYTCLTGNWRSSIAPKKLEVLRGEGQVTGTLAGGNLATLVSLLATPFDYDWRDSIVILEDIGEPLYRLDRLLTQLALSGRLGQASGIILGDFTFDSGQDFLDKVRYTEYVWRRVLELTAASGCPVWGNFPAGHCADNLTLPIGARAVMDSSQGRLHFS